MGLNDQVNNRMRSGGEGYSIFQKHVKMLRLGGDVPILFRIMPSLNPQEPNARVSWLPFRYPNQELTDWGKFINVAPMIGRGGKGYGLRKDLVSLKSFDPAADCPLEILYAYIRENEQEWGYLVREEKDASGQSSTRAVYRKPTDVYLCNVLDLNGIEKGAQLAVISRGATKSLMSPDGGLVYQIAANSVAGGNYLSQWACGDLTDPNTGPALRYYKVNEKKGQMNTGRIELHVTQQGVMRRPLTQELLAQRIDLSKPADTYMLKVTAESLIADLIELLNGRSPITGQHERVLLRQAFPQFRIPEPPVTTVQMPGMVYQQPIPQNSVPQLPPSQQAVPTSWPPSQLTPPVQDNLPGLGGTAIPGAAQFVQPTPAPIQDNLPGLGGTAIPSSAPVQGGILAEAAGTAAFPTMGNVPLPSGQAAPSTAGVVPGEHIDTSKFNKDEWLRKLKEGQKG